MAHADSIRAMQPADLDDVLAVENRVQLLPWTRGNFTDALTAGYDSLVWRSVSGELIGYGLMTVAAGEAHLMNLSVSPTQQGRGAGRTLLERLCGLARGSGAGLVLLEVRPSNGPALRLYEAAGFARIGLRRRYYPGPAGKEDALVMERIL